MRDRGFSLIELLVVIAIIGILAAVAVPAYHKYTITSRLSAAGNVVEGLLQQAILYSQNHDSGFPTAYDLNLSTTSGANSADDNLAAAVVPYYGNNLSFSSGCISKGNLGVNLNPQALGFSSDITNVSLGCLMYTANSTVSTTCYYFYSGPNGCGTDNILPGWSNYFGTSSCAPSAEALAAFTAFSQATC